MKEQTTTKDAKAQTHNVMKMKRRDNAKTRKAEVANKRRAKTQRCEDDQMHKSEDTNSRGRENVKTQEMCEDAKFLGNLVVKGQGF